MGSLCRKRQNTSNGLPSGSIHTIQSIQEKTLMRKIVTRGLYFALFVGGLSAVGCAAANAADTTSGDDSVAGGNQAIVSAVAPLTVGGTAVSVIGDSTSSGSGTAVGSPASGLVAAPASAPVSAPLATSGDSSLLGGTQGIVSVAVPVTVAGDAISVAGDSDSSDASTTVASAPAATAAPVSASTTPAPAAAPVTTSGDNSAAGGNQVAPVASVPVTVGGNAISGVGDSATSAPVTTVQPGSGQLGTGGSATSGNGSVGGGNQIVPVIAVPVTVGGNAVSVIGDSTTTGPTAVVVPTTPTVPTVPVVPTVPTVPVVPTVPTVPVVPTVPTTPTVPTIPVDPGTPTVPSAGSSGAGQAASYQASAATGAHSDPTGILALTGCNLAGIIGILALLLAAGTAMMVAGRVKRWFPAGRKS
ncbi:hypothetical protein GCM10009563_25880 [Subtercola frigoramans]